MNAVVTGGAGFIDSHVVELLQADGSEVTVLDDLSSGKRENLGAGIALTVGDVRDKQAMGAVLSGSVDCVFHLAAFELVVGHPVAREYVPARTGEVQRIALNAEKARHELGWKPSVSLEDGLDRTLAWVKTCL